MVMSQGTYTFLACFAGFWLVWAFVVMLCCFCSFLQRRLKRRREERLREQCLRTMEMEPLSCQPAGYLPPPPPPPPNPPPTQLPRDLPQFCPPQTLLPPVPLQVPHPMPQANWISMPDTDILGKPPCYEEAVLMEDPPPPYSEVLADPRGGTYLKPSPLGAAPPPLREHQDPPPVFTSEMSKLPAAAVFPNRGYSSLIRLPSSQRWDSLGHLLSNMDLNHSNLTPPGARSLHAAAAMATMPRREHRTQHDGLGLRGGIQGLQGGIDGLHGGIHGFQRGFQGFQGLQGVHGLRGLEPSCGLPTAFPLLGRSTAV
ncbi:proline-rich protein 7 [Thunnus albacares]|uniref:proline-rich protein 7 n=1 Tax=Thunnus albacares TaxID=8236 RepID=UPI001CF6A7AF|nr:proline-rich protein 7 [Thunnus albacares]XP_044227002.1 proline-rich protein 7 [Thunnus albacares]XP_044227003.1 proline-rich protein 7 [Thunnus albacares]XP_044227004.1 proline-rich protein 7 [Thunnus albacares]XP_044227005.1 proline-rich protein 7 [Thunnus albacares]XP_044227006.1 proline-rich protein 7 [Thunnus albacares]XP_044227007.1 proline-rich protein 7 [Thunnus albacares]XP_044227008.1 proline-rich protein 7 [Thunnus albacares]